MNCRVPPDANMTDKENHSGIDNDGYLTKPEMARRLRRTARTIEAWMRKGYLPFIKIGRSVLFHAPTVERHLKDNHQVIRRAGYAASPRRQLIRTQHLNQNERNAMRR